MGYHQGWTLTVTRYLFAGADVFFVLSGVIMWHSAGAQDGVGKQGVFLERRFTRIFSGYWPVLLLTFVLTPPTLRHLRPWDRIGSLLLVNSNHLELFIPQAWTLTFELYFYLLFSFLLLLPGPDRRLAYVLRFLAILLFANLYLWPGDGQFFLHFMLFEFGAGVLLGALLSNQRLPLMPVMAVMVTVGSAGLFFGVRLEYFDDLRRVLTFGLFSACLVGCVYLLDLRARLPWPRWAVALGDSSFALYLWHSYGLLLFWYTGARDHLSAHPRWGLALWVALTIAASHGYYLLFEKRFLRASRWLVDTLRRVLAQRRERVLLAASRDAEFAGRESGPR